MYWNTATETLGLSRYSLPDSGLQSTCEWKPYVVRELSVHFSDTQNQPFVLPDIQCRGKIPDRRHYIDDILSDPAKLPVETLRIIYVLDRMRAEHCLKLPVCKWQAINVVDQHEVQDVIMPDDIRIEAASIDPAATDVQVPALPTDDRVLERAVAVPMKKKDYASDRRCKGD